MNQKTNMDGLLTPQQQQDIDYNLLKNRLFRSNVLTGVFSGNTKKYPQVNSTEDDLTLVDIDYLTLEAGEDITAGDAVIVGNGTSSYLSSSYTGGTSSDYDLRDGGVLNQYHKAQSFVATGSKLVKVSIYVNVTDVGTSATYCTIYTVNGGIPQTGIGSKNGWTLSGTGWIDITFDTPLDLTIGNTYAIAVWCDQSGTQRYWRGASGNPYASGTAFNYNLTDGWSVITDYDFSFKTYEVTTTAGKAHLADASEAGDRTNNFIGFATEDATSGNNVSIKINNIVTLSSLTAGSTYYLSDTAGAIATSAGTVSKKVGLAISSTQLLIKHDN